MSTLPILYSFRRCPYAIRARLAIHLSSHELELREVVLKNKPESLLNYSPKGTVPVLVLSDESGHKTIIDESLDIMLWALENSDLHNTYHEQAKALIQQNDGEFKHYLDRYKYADRFPDATQSDYRNEALRFIEQLDQRLQQAPYLFGEELEFADLAILPFVRQFAHVDLKWFEQSEYQNVQRWLNEFKTSELFLEVMHKYPAWAEGDTPTLFK